MGSSEYEQLRCLFVLTLLDELLVERHGRGVRVLHSMLLWLTVLSIAIMDACRLALTVDCRLAE